MLGYEFSVVDPVGRVLVMEEVSFDQAPAVPVAAFRRWIHLQENKLRKQYNRGRKQHWSAYLTVSGGDVDVLIMQLNMYSEDTKLGLNEYHIERVSPHEFIRSDTAYTNLTDKASRVVVIDGEYKDAWVLIEQESLLHLVVIHCESSSKTFEVLSMGEGKCSPQFEPGWDGYQLRSYYTSEENEAWILFLMQ